MLVLSVTDAALLRKDGGAYTRAENGKCCPYVSISVQEDLEGAASAVPLSILRSLSTQTITKVGTTPRVLSSARTTANVCMLLLLVINRYLLTSFFSV